jgi:NADH-quinone oxidoreductase subunit N
VASLASFSVLMKVEQNGGSFAGLYYRNPWLAATMLIALMSMAGIPPFAGFAAKYFVFIIALSAKHTGLVLFAVAMSLVSVYYYFRIIIQMFDKNAAVEPLVISWSSRIFHFVAIVLLIALGLFPSIGQLAKLMWP